MTESINKTTNPNLRIHICDCGDACKPVPVGARIESSEFYCAKCHKSYDMPYDVARFYLDNQQR